MNTLEQCIEAFKIELDGITSIRKEFKFNTSRLPAVLEVTGYEMILLDPAFKTMFDELQKIKSNCLYWLEVKTVAEAMELKSRICVKKKELWSEDKKVCRVLPALNKNENSTVLYVGVRKGSAAKKQKITNIAGRIVQHLGYYREGRTQGLQLAYYTRELEVDITLHVYSLHNCPDEYLYILEKIMAKKLRPVCGVH